MRVVIFATEFIEMLVLDLVNSFPSSFQVVLLTPSNIRSATFEKHLSPSVIHEKFPMPRRRSPLSLFTIKNIIQKINKYKPEILHIQSNGHPWFIFGYPFLKANVVVNTIHDHAPHLGDQSSKWGDFYNKLGRFFTDHYIVHSKEVKRKFSIIQNIDKEKVDVIPLGGNSYYKLITNEKFEESKNTILFFGRIWKYKGLEVLINSEPLISEKIPDVKIIIAGRGENLDKYEDMMINKKNFKILNYRIPDEGISMLFQQSSLVVLPYLEATQSGVIPLAYSFGKPVIAANVGGLSEQLQDGIQGLLVPPNDESALAKAVINILKNKDLKKKFSRNSIEYFTKNLSGDLISNMTIDVYNKAIREKV